MRTDFNLDKHRSVRRKRSQPNLYPIFYLYLFIFWDFDIEPYCKGINLLVWVGVGDHLPIPEDGFHNPYIYLFLLMIPQGNLPF